MTKQKCEERAKGKTSKIHFKVSKNHILLLVASRAGWNSRVTNRMAKIFMDLRFYIPIVLLFFQQNAEIRKS